jgi:hypothetical protein
MKSGFRLSIRRQVIGLALFPAAVLGQNAGALHVSINYPASSVVTSMFGALPKDVSLIEVTACNDTSAALLLSHGRLVQSLRGSGIQALSRDAAISTIQTAESREWRSILLRHSTHAMNIVNFLVISKAVSLGPVLSRALPSIQALMDAIVPEFARDAPDHQYLNFDRDTLPEKTELNPLDCATGLMFTMRPKTGQAPAELTIQMQRLQATGQGTVSGSR